MKPLEITAKEAAQVMLDAYNTNSLASQAPNPLSAYYTEQEGKVFRCGIGQLYPIEDAQYLERDVPEYPMAIDLINRGLLIVDDPEFFVQAQVLHDQWHLDGPQPFLNWITEHAQ